MTATDELRRMLDERGVEWEGTDFTEPTRGHPAVTNIDVECDAMFVEYVDGPVLKLFCLTPEHAIAVTLGRGTCKPREVRSRFSKTQEHVTYYCECGHELGGYMTAEFPFPHTYNEDKLPNYCPNCGARIEVDG